VATLPVRPDLIVQDVVLVGERMGTVTARTKRVAKRDDRARNLVDAVAAG
jgi:hypothetical protein